MLQKAWRSITEALERYYRRLVIILEVLSATEYYIFLIGVNYIFYYQSTLCA